MIAALQKNIGATDSTPKIDNASEIQQAGPSLEQLQVEFDPNPRPLRDKDFRKLEEFIEKYRGGTSGFREPRQIRAYRPSVECR